MQKFILIPDSFKGTLSSTQICSIMKERLLYHFPNASVVSIPVADGGEGSVDCFLTALGGEKITKEVNNPFFERIESFYGLIDGGKTAVIEMAAAAGLPLVEDRKNPLTATTFGVGELIMDAANRGVKKIIVGLGGSATNDFGCGAAAACGVKFFDKDGKEFIPTGGTLIDIKKVDISSKNAILDKIEIVTMCDIDNPPFGERGAAKVFAPQKGADEKTVEFLDTGVRHLSELLEKDNGVKTSNLAGGGAAGAFGAGMVAFFNSTLKMGIEVVLDTVGFDTVLDGASVVFTGEGKLDGQSLGGKVVIGVSRAAKKKGVPVIAVVGGADRDIEPVYGEGVTAVFTINRLPEDFSISRNKSEENLRLSFDNVCRALKI
jgi:glycerate kinase